MKSRTKLRISSAYVLSHPIRTAIIKILREKGEAYPAQIAKELGLSERLVTFHLSVLSSAELVKSRYGLTNPVKSPPRAVRYYRATSKVDEAVDEFAASLK